MLGSKRARELDEATDIHSDSEKSSSRDAQQPITAAGRIHGEGGPLDSDDESRDRKRLRLAREYLSKIGAGTSGPDGAHDEVAARLEEDAELETQAAVQEVATSIVGTDWAESLRFMRGHNVSALKCVSAQASLCPSASTAFAGLDSSSLPCAARPNLCCYVEPELLHFPPGQQQTGPSVGGIGLVQLVGSFHEPPSPASQDCCGGVRVKGLLSVGVGLAHRRSGAVGGPPPYPRRRGCRQAGAWWWRQPQGIGGHGGCRAQGIRGGSRFERRKASPPHGSHGLPCSRAWGRPRSGPRTRSEAGAGRGGIERPCDWLAVLARKVSGGALCRGARCLDIFGWQHGGEWGGRFHG